MLTAMSLTTKKYIPHGARCSSCRRCVFRGKDATEKSSTRTAVNANAVVATLYNFMDCISVLLAELGE